MKLSYLRKLTERLPRSQQWRGMCDDSCGCEACTLDEVRDLLPKLLAVAEAASAVPIREGWNESYCNREESDALYEAQDALRTALNLLEAAP